MHACLKHLKITIVLCPLVWSTVPRGLFGQSTTAALNANAELTSMRAQLKAIETRQPFDYPAYKALNSVLRARLAILIERDALRTPADFLTASLLAGDPLGFYESRRVAHELALAALVLRHPDALRRVALTWDGLNLSVGRGQRLGSLKRNDVAMDMDPVPAPLVLRDLFADHGAALERAAGTADNAELEKLRADDQALRDGPVDSARMDRMQAEDPPRRERVLQVIAARALMTGRDFHNAALVLQHGQGVDAYRLAHELAIAAVALGDTSATWLVSRTYDRLLLAMGHRQRLNTQYDGGTGTLLPTDTTLVNDRIRGILGSRPLSAARQPLPH